MHQESYNWSEKIVLGLSDKLLYDLPYFHHYATDYATPRSKFYHLMKQNQKGPSVTQLNTHLEIEMSRIFQVFKKNFYCMKILRLKGTQSTTSLVELEIQ